MFNKPIDLAKARILVSNDDGINADGLAILERIARELSDDVWVVAPEIEQSGAGHSLTLHQPLRFRPIEEKRFAVSGTPTDCGQWAEWRPGSPTNWEPRSTSSQAGRI